MQCLRGFLHALPVSNYPTTSWWDLDLGFDLASPEPSISFYCFFIFQPRWKWTHWNVWGSLSCCKVHFWLNFNLLTDDFTLSSSSLWYYEQFIVDSFPNHNISTTMLWAGIRLLVKCSFWFLPNMVPGTLAK